MGVLDRFERGIEKAVNGAFARAFKSEVQPVEIASALCRAMDDRAAVVGRGRTIVPNQFVVELGPTDYGRLSEYADVLAQELLTSVAEHADAQQYAFPGPVSVELEEREGLDTGVFQVRSSSVRGAPDAPPAADHRPVPAAAAPAAAPPVAVPPTVLPPVSAPLPGAFPFPQSAPAAELAAPASVGEPSPAPTVAPTQPAPVQVAPARRPWLDVDGHAYPLLGDVTVIGRGDGVDVVVDDPGVSRRHAEVRITSDAGALVARLRDLGSTNGCFVDGNRVTNAVLSDRSTITLGRTRLTFRSGER